MKLFSPILLILFFITAFSCDQKKERTQESIPLGWDVKTTPVKASLRGLSPLTENIIWASGSNGTWMRTLNGGETWDFGVIDGLDSVDFRDIEAFDAKTAVVVSAGQPAVVYRTDDGGSSWKKVYQGSDRDFFDGMAFYKNRGMIIGDEVEGKWSVLVTSDFGNSWKELETSPDAVTGSGSFAASGSGIVMDEDKVWFASGGEVSNVYFSNDRGIIWVEKSTPIIQGKPSQGIFSLTLIGKNLLLGLGGDYAQADLIENNAVISKDGGMSWGLTGGSLPSGYRSGVTYFSLKHWTIAVGPNGSDFSKNGGSDWERFSDESLHAVFVDKTQSSIWASGPDGKIAKLLY
jgi:photosystem II stability/assembly factor-like uncharacterized protein